MSVKTNVQMDNCPKTQVTDIHLQLKYEYLLHTSHPQIWQITNIHPGMKNKFATTVFPKPGSMRNQGINYKK